MLTKYVDIFNSMLDKLSIDKFKLIVNDVKLQVKDLELPDSYFEDLINKYIKYYNEYKNIVKKRLRWIKNILVFMNYLNI